MDMQSRNQYLRALIEKRGYLLKSKKEKSKLLDEYCKTTGQNRNYVIRKIRKGAYLKSGFGKRRRKEYYDGYVKEALVKIYLRYDTKEELEIINDLYQNELRLYKNFFQPVIKLISKERVGGKIHRKYDIPKTPYQRVMESKEVSEEKKQGLKKIYESLNPAELKRIIDRKLNLLYKAYQKKNKSIKVEPKKKLEPNGKSLIILVVKGWRLSLKLEWLRD
jgi:hypothetical protein